MNTSVLNVNGITFTIYDSYTPQVIYMIIADRLNTTTRMVWFPEFVSTVSDDAPRSGVHSAVDMYMYIRDMVSPSNADGPRSLSDAVQMVKSWVDRDPESNTKFVEHCIIDAYTSNREVNDDVDAQTCVLLDAIITQDVTGNDIHGPEYYREVVRSFRDRCMEHSRNIAANKRLVPMYVTMYSNWSNTTAPTMANMDVEAIRGKYTVYVPEPDERPTVILFNDLVMSEDLVVFAKYGEWLKYDARHPPTADTALSAMSRRTGTKVNNRERNHIALFMVRRGIYSPGMTYDIAHVYPAPGVGYTISVLSNNAPTVDVPRSITTAMGLGGDGIEVSDAGGGVTYTASFVLNDITFVTEYLQHFTLMKCTNKATCIFIDETHLMRHAKEWRRFTISSPRFIYEYNNYTVRFSVTVESTRRDVARVAPYSRIRIYDAPNTNVLYGIANDITSHMIQYKSEELDILKFYTEHLHTDELLNINVRVLRDSKRVKRTPGQLAGQHRQVRRRIQAQRDGDHVDVRSIINVNNYARQCAKLPTVVRSVDLVPDGKEHITFSPGRGLPDVYLYCNHDDAPYPGLAANRLAGNSDEHPFLPCCYRVRRNAAADACDNDSLAPEVRSQTFYNTQRVLPLTAFGKCPGNLEAMLAVQRYCRSTDTNSATFYPKEKVVQGATAVRGAVQVGPNAAIEAVMRAVHCLQSSTADPRSLVIGAEQLERERSKMMEYITCAGQELFDMSSGERLSWLKDNTSYFDPLRLVKLLQYHFDTNVFLYVRGSTVKPVRSIAKTESQRVRLKFYDDYTQAWNDNEDVLSIPYHYAGADYHDMKIHERSVVLYVHSGTEITTLAHPHVEYVLFENHCYITDTIRKTYQALLPQPMRAVYSFVYFDVDDATEEELDVDTANALRAIYYVSKGKQLSAHWRDVAVANSDKTAPRSQTIDGVGRLIGMDGVQLETIRSVEPLPSLPIDNHHHSMFSFHDNMNRRELLNPEHSAKCTYTWYLSKLTRVLLHLTAYTILKKGTLMSELFTVDERRFNLLHDTINSLFEAGVVDRASYMNLLIVEQDRVLTDSVDTARRLVYNASLLLRRMSAYETSEIRKSRYITELLRYETDFTSDESPFSIVTSIDKFILKPRPKTVSLFRPPLSLKHDDTNTVLVQYSVDKHYLSRRVDDAELMRLSDAMRSNTFKEISFDMFDTLYGNGDDADVRERERTSPTLILHVWRNETSSWTVLECTDDVDSEYAGVYFHLNAADPKDRITLKRLTLC
ncbi:hypothetical protein [Heliothis virescens ascovirus 3e]|uniref:Putative structural protein ORF146 n=1 Tax=Heliothis virescens ascovirus 3e TaxID=260797 RepID=Y146_HVAVE|nr:hypothetical protein HVAV3e_gp144 [Heliothis virescens ascovirus 3e]A4KXK0.1 RecName: Full=Putative structural protein ORF146 [Heliothis virescens ascovirus 3e]ABO37331.1 hypothetical protein [Heliothis virescens ascovirus 3e]